MRRAAFFLLALLLLAPAAYAATAPLAPEWNISMSASGVTFRGKQMGTEFKGTISKYKPEIHFDADHLDHSAVTVDFDMSSLSTGDKDRDATAVTAEWFDLPHYPIARFTAEKFKKTGDNAYEVDGTLTIKGVAVPLNFPFTITFGTVSSGAGKAHIKGSVTLDRSKFSLGIGQWADTSVIANDVVVDVDLMAYEKRIPAK